VAENMKLRFGWAALAGLLGAAVLGPLVFALGEVKSLSEEVAQVGERQGAIDQRLEALQRAQSRSAASADQRAASAVAEAERFARLEAAVRTLEARAGKPDANGKAVAPVRSELPAPPAPSRLRPRPKAKSASLALEPVLPAVARVPSTFRHPQLFAEPAQPQQLADRRLGL
jgi:hypothetical protein